MGALPMLNEHQIPILIFSYVFFSGAVLAAWLFFLHSIRKTLRLVPKNHRIFPIWFLGVTALFALSYALSWSVSIPGVSLLAGFIGLIFSWIMFPFAVPKSLYSLAHHDENLQRKIRNLGYIGLINQIGVLILFAIKVFLFFLPQGEEDLLVLADPHSGSLLSFILALILALIAVTVVVSWVFYWARVVFIRSDLRQ
jgi:hypothetical protein